MSTMLLTGRMPAWRRRERIQSGEGPILTLWTTRPTYREQRSGVSMATRAQDDVDGPAPVDGAGTTGVKRVPRVTAASLPNPSMQKQSGRLDVISKSTTV